MRFTNQVPVLNLQLFAEGGAATQAGSGLFTTQIAIIAGVTLIGVIGFIWLIKRFYNRIKH